MKINEYTNVIAAVGAILTLVFVGYQVNQNTRVLKNQANLDLLMASFSLRATITENKEVATLIFKATNDYATLEEIEQVQYQAYVSRTFDIWEHAFQLNASGLIDQSTWQAWNGAYLPTLKYDGPREYWRRYQIDFSPEFRNYIDNNK